jgi:hypothetical protein
LKRSAVTNWGVLNADQTIGFGLEYVAGGPIAYLLVQIIDSEGSTFATGSMGMYLEADREASYPDVLQFHFRPVESCVRMELAGELISDTSAIEIELPRSPTSVLGAIELTDLIPRRPNKHLGS